jgi:septal ring factor EnvC (AmiA/AmiB activator)
MLQASEIQQRFTTIRRTIGEAERACESAGDSSPELREHLHKLADEARSADAIIRSAQQEQIVECIDRLEDMGDEAKRLSRSDDHISAKLESAVTKVHAELSQLKHQLH